ncbi:exodeoxyribonuclease VII small subunit [Candidatus Uhrbacteria bacterium]|nr:exodeoxyribonuclease VII small subunit [Candidatus Uhrbacteria bacterium]
MAIKKEMKEIDVAKGFSELEDISAWFERGEADVDTGLKKFERAMMIADLLKKKLDEAENKVKDIKQKFS